MRASLVQVGPHPALMAAEVVVRDGLNTILSALPGIRVVGLAHDGAEAIALAGQHAARVVLMDLRMPGTDGIEATRTLRATQPTTAVVVLTTYLDDESVLAALQAGAVGYLTKNAAPDDIHRAIEAAVAGHAVLDVQAAAHLIGATGRHSPPSAAAAPPDGLSPREVEVLALIAHGLSNTQIADHLVISASTVKTHINQIFAKTGSRDRAQAVIYAHQHGIAPPTTRA